MSSAAGGIVSVRPEMTIALTARTGLDDQVLTRLVHLFYARLRADPVLGPIFIARIADWPRHLERMVAFWSSVTLMTGRYHGATIPAHIGLPVGEAEFRRWLAIFHDTAAETCPPEGARLVIRRAEQIARRLHLAIAAARHHPEERDLT